jgi:hypothetical protein
MENFQEQELPLLTCFGPPTQVRGAEILVTGKQQKPRGGKTRARSGSGVPSLCRANISPSGIGCRRRYSSRCWLVSLGCRCTFRLGLRKSPGDGYPWTSRSISRSRIVRFSHACACPNSRVLPCLVVVVGRTPGARLLCVSGHGIHEMV